MEKKTVMKIQSIECSICSERFGVCGGGESSEIICVTPCGHVYHDCCISGWLTGSKPNTCPECRDSLTTNDLRPIYFNYAPLIDNEQSYINDLESEIISTANKYQRVRLQNIKLKNDFSNQIREKDIENQKLQEAVLKLKHDLQKLKHDLQKHSHDLQKHQKLEKAHRARSKYADVVSADQLYQMPVDMTAHNPNAMQNAMQLAMYHQGLPSTSSAMLMNDSIQATTSGSSNQSSTFTSNAGGTTQCHSSADTSSSHSSRQLFQSSEDPNASGGPNFQTMYERYPYLFQHQTMNQSSIIQNNYIAWMASGNSPMLMPTNDTAAQPNVSYSQNLFLQQSQPQPNANINSANVNLSYVNASNNVFLDM